MEQRDDIARLLSSLARGEKRIVRIKVDTALEGPLAVQFELLRALKNEDFDEKSFTNMLLICGLAEVSKTLLKELLSVKGVTHSMLAKIFDEFGKAI